MVAGCGAGVPAAGVVGVESDAFSALEFGAAGSVVEVSGDSLDLIGDSSLAKSGSTMGRSLTGEVLMVTRMLVRLLVVMAAEVAALLLLGLRRSLAVECLLGGMIERELDDKMPEMQSLECGDGDVGGGDGEGNEGNFALSRWFGDGKLTVGVWCFGALAQADGSGEGQRRSTGWLVVRGPTISWGENLP